MSSTLPDEGCELPAVESGDSLAFQACHASEGSLEGASDEPHDATAESECFDPMNSVRRLLALRPLWPLSMCYPADEDDAASFASPSGWSLGQGALDDDDDDDRDEDDDDDDDDERPSAGALPSRSGVVPRLGQWEQEDG